jgi:BolA family transcriptional regulator, general stress-responsive regulator
MAQVLSPTYRTYQQQLEDRLAALSPTVLDVVNESRGHGGYVEGKESHFKVVIVSEDFRGVRAVQRHQKVYAAVGDLLAASKIHALAIHAYTADEWQGQSVESPKCAR